LSEPSLVLRSIDNLQIATCVIGQGQPVLALHGWGGNARSFWPVAERLSAQSYQVHLLDLPGFGQSELPPQTWGVGDYVRFIVTYLNTAGLDRVSVLGHSFGGRIALVLAADHPARVHKMVLANSAGLRTAPSLKQRARGFWAGIVRKTLDTLGLKTWRAHLQESYNRRYASQDFLTAGPLRDTFLRVIQEDLTPFAQRVQAPTLLIWGDQDADTPLWQGQKLEQLIPDAGLVVFKGAGHFSYLERLNDYLRIVDHFLTEGS
jgi:pimeloyl-ACP methyl ester carboxylesterase